MSSNSTFLSSRPKVCLQRFK